MSDALLNTLLVVGGGFIGSILLFFGARFTARQARTAAETAAKVSDRQVDVDEWRSIVAALRDEVSRLAGRVDSLERTAEARDAIHRAIIRYVHEVLTWARVVAPLETPPPPSDTVRDELLL